VVVTRGLRRASRSSPAAPSSWTPRAGCARRARRWSAVPGQSEAPQVSGDLRPA
jgi:hypothetical protein